MSLTVLIDTNVMMVALSPLSNLHWIYKDIINNEFRLAISNEILLEYEEQVAKRYSKEIVSDFLLILFEAPNVIHCESYFKWNLITQDADDNKFSDCALSSSADYLITHDKHFDVLKRIKFPLIKVINAFEFEAVMKNKRKNK